MNEALEHALADSAILEQVFVDSPLPIQILDADGASRRENDAHRAFVRAFGEAVGIGDFNALRDPRSKAGGHVEPMKTACGGTPVSYEIETVDSSVDGEEPEPTCFERLLMPIASADGGITAVVSVLVDTTDRRRAEREKAQLNQQLLHAQKLESLGVLAGGIAHDFNNILVGVLGNAGLLLERLDEDSDLRQYAKGIERAARRAADVARQMLAYAGKGAFVVEPINLSEIVQDTAELLRISVSKTTVLEQELDTNLPRVRADVTQVRQVVMNLITNASEAAGDSGTIVLRTGTMDRDAAYLVGCYGAPDTSIRRFAFVEVEDDGIGMDEATVRRIFDPFFTTKFTGRGLGLAAVLGIVRGHGGAIRIDSTPGVGTKMRVLFPEDLSVARVVAVSESSTETFRGQGRAIVADDEPQVRSTAGRMLEQLGFSVIEASNGGEALDLFRKHRDDVTLALLDVTMPKLDGVRAFEQLRGLDPSTRVVLMSGYDMTAVPQSVPFIQKPFTMADLARVLQRTFSAAEASRG